MVDIVPELLRRTQEAFRENLKSNKRAAALLKAIFDGSTAYADASAYAYEVGDALAAAFAANMSAENLPHGKMYENIARRTVEPLLRENYTQVSVAAMQVQGTINARAGIGVKVQHAPFSVDRADGIIRKIANATNYDDAEWMLAEPVRNFSMAVVDRVLESNVTFLGKAGLEPSIIRRAESKCCKWCAKLEGTYPYPDIPQDVYRRHERCRCTVEYDEGDGHRKNVWTKQWTTSEERDKIEVRKQVGVVQTMPDYQKAAISDDKVNRFFLNATKKHSVEFFDVGYTATDGEQLKADLRRGLSANPARLSKAATDEVPKYIVDMKLGITKHKTFRTVWWRDSPDGLRIVTAHRIKEGENV